MRMAQSKVTEYFASRKRSFDIIQPSKKLKLNVEFEPHSKSTSLASVRTRPAVSTSTKRFAKRKQVTGTAGNIKTFLERNSKHTKQFKPNEDRPIEPVSGLSNETTTAVNFGHDTIMPGVKKTTIESRGEKILKKALNVNGNLSEHKHNTSDNKSKLPDFQKITSFTTNSSVTTECTPNSPEAVSRVSSLNVHKNPVRGIEIMRNDIPGNIEKCASKNTAKLTLFMERLNNFKERNSKVENHAASDYKRSSQQETKSTVKIDCKNTENHALLKEKINRFKEGSRKILKPQTAVPEVPAYERFNSLAEKDFETSLVLPFKYRLLYEVFRSIETVMSLLHNRKEVCTFDKLKSSVQQLLKRNFDEKHLSQIASVYPTAYTFQLEKGVKCFASLKSKTSLEQLTITPNLVSQQNSTLSEEPSSIQITPSVILIRDKTFRRNLINITKGYHETFLLTQTPPVRVPMDQVMRWHPKFPLDSVPDIVSATLPSRKENNISTAKDILDRVQGVVGERIEKALTSAVHEKPFTALISNATPKAAVIQKKASGAIKGTYQALLEKVRAKESIKVIRDILRSPEAERKIEMLSRLPELARIVRTFFVTEKRAAVALEEVKMKVCDSLHSQMSPEEIATHLNLLASVAPKWLFFVTIPKGVFLKIDKNMQLSDIVNFINAEIAREKA